MILMVLVTPAFAQEGKPDLMEQAVEYGAKADAYNAHCDKESHLADSFIEKFIEKRGISSDKAQNLRDLRDKEAKATRFALAKDAKTCKDLEFMMVRLDVMRKLKDISYLLNGVDPATLPEDQFPNIEELLPPTMDAPPQQEL